MLQSKEDLAAHLREQMEFLHASSKSYDDGLVGEAKRLAVVIAALVHDTKNSKSLLTQLKRKDIRFYDTGAQSDLRHQHIKAVFDAPNPKTGKKWKGGVLHSQRLVLLASNSNADGQNRPYPPLLKGGLKGCNKLVFDDWWNQNAVNNVRGEKFLTRKELVLAMRNKDGGAHIDPNLSPKYAELTRSDGFKLTMILGGVPAVENGPEPGTVRQIAFEVLHSIQTQLCDLVG
jgi:hypothetical protein